MLYRVWAVLMLFVAGGIAQNANKPVCSPLPQGITENIEAYLTHKVLSVKEFAPIVKSIELLPQSCYHKVVLTLPDTGHDFEMYLSPDSRYLMATVYDLSRDPESDAAELASDVDRILLRDRSPGFSGSTPKVTIVAFIDFQCPYCRRFEGWYANLPPALREQSALAVKNLPLPQHSWATAAARVAACAGLQSPLAYQQVSSFFFANQGEIAPYNLENKLDSQFRSANEVNLDELNACVADGRGANIIDRDVAVATRLEVRGTPTLFINGRRVFKLSSQEDLEQLLQRTLTRHTIPTTANEVGTNR